VTVTQVGEHIALINETRVGKARFLEFYANVRQIGLSKANIQSRWRAIGLYPKNVNKPLRSCWVVVPKAKILPPPSNFNILTLKRSCDLLQLLGDKNRSLTSRLSVRKAAIALDKVAIEVALRDREIERLQVQLKNANPPKRRKVA
jgi:hypothetical protein